MFQSVLQKGHVVTVKALCYKLEGSSPIEVTEFFSISLIIPAALGLGVLLAL
jgi:hypothetical protein